MSLRLAIVCALTATFGCEPETIPNTSLQLPALRVAGWTPDIVMAGTRVEVTGTGFLPPSLGAQTLRLTDGVVTVDVAADWRDSEHLDYTVDDRLLSVLTPGTRFEGALRVVRRLAETGAADEAAGPTAFEVVDNLAPTIVGFNGDDTEMFPGDAVPVSGQDLLLPGEGTTLALLQGTFVTLVPPETRVAQAVLPLELHSRTEAGLLLTPDVFGIRPGTFEGSVTLVNENHAGRRDGSRLDGVVQHLRPPRIQAISPATAARGQRIVIEGRGFLPTDPLFAATTLIRLEGAFQAKAASTSVLLHGPTALDLFPDAFDGNRRMDYVLRVLQTPSGELTGLGLVAGGFDGTVTPMLLSGADTILGAPYPFLLTVGLQRQVVFVSFLPGFEETLAEFGLRHAADRVRQRILDVCARDYSGVNIEFRDERPTEFVEYSVIEVGGADPNNADLFGLDNTTGKDVGNIRFDDVIGGTNAETAEQGYYAFGGVFVRSFLLMSPALTPAGKAPHSIASGRFDDIFAPFIPALGGTPATEPDATGPRAGLLDQAVTVLGNLVGTTVSHEVGHSLGLANIDGKFHNEGDNPGWIMDAGSFRPFAERAEVDGQGPGVFSPNNASYLRRILPTDVERP